MKRLCVFFFYDRQGIVDEYVEVLLDGMVHNVEKLAVVCNGVLSPEGRRIFRKYTDLIIVRENTGLDVWAYKTAIEYLGWDEIYKYDEFIMMNHTICGPLFPLENMFAEMDSIDVDFWGLTMYYGGNIRPKDWPENGFDTIQDHIQSHFIAVRHHMLTSFEFRKYWEDMPSIDSYEESVALHESVFTKKFSDIGFTYHVYINDCDPEICRYPLMFYSHELIRKKKCPVVKRKRNVYLPFEGLQNSDFNYGLRDMFEAINECTDYDIDLIYKSTLRTSPLYFFQRGSLTDFISSEKGNAVYKNIDKEKTGIILNINNPDLFKYFGDQLNRILSGFEVIVIADKDHDVREYLDSDVKIAARYDLGSSGQFLSIPEEHADKYKYLFLLSFDNMSKRFKSLDYNTLKMEFDSFIYSAGQMNYVADAFDNNKLLGLLVPPFPIASANRYSLTSYRLNNSKCIKQYSEYLDVVYSEDNHYYFPANNIFACKPEVIKGFSASLEKCFGSSDNLPYDLLLPLYAQSKGYYTGRVMTEYNAKIHISMLEDMLYNKGEIK